MMRHITLISTTAFLLNNAWAQSADFNSDGVVDLRDFFTFAEVFGREVSDSNEKFDLSRDGLIVLDDFFLFADQFGKDIDTGGEVVALQPDAAGKDGFVGYDEDGASQVLRYYREPTLFVGASFPGAHVNKDRKFRSYLQFDLSGLPAGAQILSAELSLYSDWADSPAEVTIDVYSVTGSWLEDDLTWETAPGTGAVVSSTRVGEAEGWYTWDLTSMVSDWRAGAPNFGLMLRERAESFDHFGVKRFLASEGREASLRPLLTVRYGPGGAVARELTVELPGGATMDFVWIQPGTFAMGSPNSEPGRYGNEGPQHQVAISRGFWLGKFEITQAEWESVMGARPWSGQPYVQENPDHPAAYVSWHDVQEFSERLNEASWEGLYRLPTEAEWEYAGRAGASTRWSFGQDETELGSYAWYWDNAWDAGLRFAQPVGTKWPNPWGLYDMHANVGEWVQDRYGTYSSASQVDPQGPATGSSRVVRGGFFYGNARDTRSANRSGASPGDRFHHGGARLLRTR